ncbi:poly-beta-1,6-N-acetyl-D-glucosamine synthase [Phocicoccus pinnipedialis]|uniref:Poly-beta-1,6-N-acetyl-D-glucosamine synthase n=1 Tax=Phocicoccus pinnipedialis TaxID=110845 RepID=A0A6V7RMI8_9BACL|nr:poly-beta-1,6-N-acetyl-D-glucosamine synthase [Jeotgalicoccus pinnipedialis]MBP1940228.1 biofilm PGA synthesis N-glycosyltransferase PgaC [Jeotgalicoccus pinnipedialis]CAD2079603.1 Poly-beta-1,6-N-acetyl-D-glucosamine synthase [Jeotgalicoccus pinnipedialis]
MKVFINFLSTFLIAYPIMMSLVWIVGAILYYLLVERKFNKEPQTKDVFEGISFLIPCYNEAETIEETLTNVLNLSYPKKEIILINDGSSDDTVKKVTALKELYDFKFIDLKENRGKANALNTAVKEAQYDFVMGIDADTIIEDDAPYFMIENFRKAPRLGAVTGNPRIRNKSSIFGKIQTVEYASIIGSIKRAQTMNGYVNTISGVFTLFRKSALKEVGYWDNDMITEDIAVSWKFHMNRFEILYEPRALCWMLVPETFSGIWKQRLRWAQGGHEVVLREFKHMFKKKSLPLWLLYLEQFLSIFWVYSVLFLLVFTVINIDFLDYYFYAYNFNILLLGSIILTTVNIFQFTVSLIIDSRYEKKNILYLFFLCWYPTFYWLINACVAVCAFPKALRRKKGEFATWLSPDRGNIQR